MKRPAVLALASLVVAAAASADDKAAPLAKQEEITLEGAGFFDLVAVDSSAQRLYAAHSPTVDVVDLAKGERVGQVEGVDGAHGVAVLPDGNRGVAAAGKRAKLVVFDLETLKATREVDTGEGPDAVLYVATTKEVWAFNGKAKTVTCVDAATLEVKATIALEGMPELAVEHAEKGLVYVNFEDKSAVCAIDAKAHKALGTHPVAPGEGPTGLAFDAKSGLLFVGCGNKKLVVLDASTWAAVASLDIGERCDGVAFDPGTNHVFASCNGLTAVVHEKDAKTFEALPSLETPGGKTCAADPATHRLYVMSGPRRGQPGTVKVLVFGPP